MGRCPAVLTNANHWWNSWAIIPTVISTRSHEYLCVHYVRLSLIRRRLDHCRSTIQVGRLQIIVRLAEESGWGYTRIGGELRKLGVRSVARSTVRNILLAHGIDPGPLR